MKLLIVEDEADLRYLLKFECEKAGHTVICEEDGIGALERIKHETFDLVVCDVMMPRLDGFNLLRQVRLFSEIPFMFLTARGDEMDKVLGFGLGADDYLIKPFSMSELLARIEALHRRCQRQTNLPTHVRIGQITLDTTGCQVYKDNQEIILNTKEYQLLKYFMEHPARVFTKAQLYEAIWQQDSFVDDNTIMVHVSHLRKLIEDDPRNPIYIQTVHGIGYRFCKAEEKA